jgi:arsenite methyltransferase
LTAATRDRWAEWLLERRFGGNPEALEGTMRFLAPVRDRVVEGAVAGGESDLALDVGAGDGLIAFALLERGWDVIFSDVSEDLLDHARAIASDLGLADRCRFVRAPAQDLQEVDDASVGAVTMRSVLIYLPRDAKPRAFDEFHRVLRPGGRLSLFEPINRFAFPEPPGRFYGYEAGPLTDLVERIKEHYRAVSSDETLIDFDERDLLDFVTAAGFVDVQLDYEARIHDRSPPWEHPSRTWETWLRSSGNPCAPTLGEVLEAALTADERAAFEAHFRPLFEARQGQSRSAVAYLRARKADA